MGGGYPPYPPPLYPPLKCVKYANEMTDDIIHSTQYYLKYINGAVLATLLHRPLKLGRLIVVQENTPAVIKVLFPWQLTLFQSPPNLFQYVSDFELEKRQMGSQTRTYMPAGSCIRSIICKYEIAKGAQKRS